MSKDKSIIVGIPTKLLIIISVVIIIGIVIGNISFADTTETSTCPNSENGSHNIIAATCTTQRKCDRCNAVFGPALGHKYVDSTCIQPKTCERCKLTEGNALGHTGGTHENDGKCTRCKEKYQNHDITIQIAGYTTSSSGHIPLYKCGFEECKSTHTGINSTHIVTEYIDNANGTHSAICNICKYKIVENHTTGADKCEKCGYVNNIKTIDNTKVNNVIPHAGEYNSIFIIMLLILIAIIFAIKLNKYKDII